MKYKGLLPQFPPGTTAKTGEPCPKGGLWYPYENPDVTYAIGVTNIMPPPPKKESHWVLGIPSTGN